MWFKFVGGARLAVFWSRPLAVQCGWHEYSGDTELESTRYGAVLGREGASARIYVNGLRVAEEPDFRFSYNITSLTKGLRAALNRERSNVGRQAYSDRVKAILLGCSSSDVAGRLAADLAESDGYRIVVVPETVAERLPQLEDVEGNPLRDLGEYRDEWNRSFEYDFVPPDALTDSERTVFGLATPILALLRSETSHVKDVVVSRTMRINA